MSQLSFDYSELIFMIDEGGISDSQLERLKSFLGVNIFYIRKAGDSLSLLNTDSLKEFAPEHANFADLKFSELGLKPGESAGVIGKRSTYIPVLHLVLLEKDKWCFKFMMPESLRKKYIERGYQFSEFVVNREAQIKLNFWSNPWGEDPEGRSMYREWKRQNHIQDFV